MNVINIEKFQTFLEENLKRQPFDLKDCLADLRKRMGETGTSDYELASWETRSGNPEVIRFDREDRFLRDGIEVSPDDDWDDIETTITF